MKYKSIVLGISVALIGSLSFAKDGFEYYGSWSNVEVSASEDPHAQGYELILWKYKGKLLGYLYNFVGPLADAPMGTIENATFDDKTGKISFSTKMSIGSIHEKALNKWVPSRDVYSFDGRIKDNDLKGTFSWKNQQLKKPVTEEVVLKHKTVADVSWHEKTYEEWKQYYGPAVKARGPKW